VTLRGVAHPTIAEADGGFTLQTKDLAIPGAARSNFRSCRPRRADPQGTLQVAAGAGGAETGTPPGNSVVGAQFRRVIGFLWLYSRGAKRLRIEPDRLSAQLPRSFAWSAPRLKSLDPRDVVERKREIDVQHIAKPERVLPSRRPIHVPQHPGSLCR